MLAALPTAPGAPTADAILDSLPQGVFVVDGLGMVVRANLAVAQQLDQDRSRVVGERLDGALDLPPGSWEAMREEADLYGSHACTIAIGMLQTPTRLEVSPLFCGAGPHYAVTVSPTAEGSLAPVAQLSLALRGRSAPALARATDLLDTALGSGASTVGTKLLRRLERTLQAEVEPDWSPREQARLAIRLTGGKRHDRIELNASPTVPERLEGRSDLPMALMSALISAHAPPRSRTELTLSYEAQPSRLHIVLDPALDLDAPAPELLALLEASGANLDHDAHAMVVSLIAQPIVVDGAPSAPIAPAPHVEPELSAEVHVLLVEDDAVTALVNQNRIERLGVRVSVAVNGADAIEQAGRTRFDGVVLDCMLPDMNGRTVFNALRGLPESLRPPHIVACSGMIRGDLPGGMQGAPVDGILEKPVSELELRRVMAPILAIPAQQRVVVRGELPVLDTETIASLRAMGGGGALVDQVLQRFLDDLSAAHMELAGALGRADLDAIARTAHQLKGAAATVGAARIEALCLHMETEAIHGDFGKVAPDIARLISEARQVEEALAARYA